MDNSGVFLVVFFDTRLSFSGICDKNINLLGGLEVEFSLFRHEDAHHQSNQRIEPAKARFFAVELVVTPVVTGGSMAIGDKHLVGTRLADLVGIEVAAGENDIELAKIEIAKSFDAKSRKEAVILTQ